MGGDLYRLVLVLAATGARFSQVVRMTVSDCRHKEGRFLVPVSRKGRGAKNDYITVPVGRDVLDALLPVTVDRPMNGPLLQRWRYEQVRGGIRWVRCGRASWQSSSELVRPWRAVREHVDMPDAIPYALRRSSIVKGIRGNLPIRLVAALHDASTAMVERHYSKWIASGLEEMARAAIVPLVPQEDGADIVRPQSVRPAKELRCCRAMPFLFGIVELSVPVPNSFRAFSALVPFAVCVPDSATLNQLCLRRRQ